MTKKMLCHTKDFVINYQTLTRVIEELTKLKNTYGDADVYVDSDGKCYIAYIVEETDQEYAIRIFTEKQEIEKCTEYDLEVRRKQYEKLKKEFE
jgi:hypothetical protein